MNKVLNGRLIFVLIVTALSLWMVYPTFNYFMFVRGMSETPTDAELEQQRELLDGARTINLGLDLRGGVDFLIAVDTDALMEENLQNAADLLRNDLASDEVDASLSVDREARTITIELADATRDRNFAMGILEEREGTFNVVENFGETGRAVVRLAEERSQSDLNDAVDASLETIKRRVDEYGLTQPEVVKQGRDRIRVKIPGETDPERIRENLLKEAQLEFRLLHPQHDQLISEFVDPDGTVRDEYLTQVEVEGIGGNTMKTTLVDFVPGVPPGYELFLGKDTRTDSQSGEKIVTENLGYLLKARPELTGKNLRQASAITDPNDLQDPIKVSIAFDAEGADKFFETTQDHQGERFAIVLDDLVFSAPRINEPIPNGRAEISGGFSQQDARDLALVLKAGALPAPLKVINQQAVGASLGADSVRDSGRALLIGAVALVFLLIAIYRVAGVMAVLAMLLNVLLILAILSMADATLTLSGIGGILLTMGMAVDANVLIYERLREELEDGKPMRAAINAAFGKAFSVILDSNITTLLPALVLILFEVVEGSVKGFWTALAIGLIVNLYTGLTVTRALVDGYVAKTKKFNVGRWRPFAKANYDFMGWRKLGYPISGALLLISVIYVGLHGNSILGVDFTGGVVATVRYTSEEVTRGGLEESLDQEFDDVRVVRVLNENLYQVTVPITDNPDTGELYATEEIASIIGAQLSDTYGDSVSIASTEEVEALLGSEFTMTAIFTILVASLVILGYIAFRFRPIFGLGAVAALLHDLIITLGLFIVFSDLGFAGSITLDIVSALLIILGYSVNDTIVVFDRIRETMGETYGKRMGEIINIAINATLSRTVFTSGTTLLTVLAMLIFGGVGLKDFSLVLLIGILAGTYSSIFVASALVYTYITKKEKKEGLVKAHGTTKTVKVGA
ncbi:MAG: protein translocase subunit SecD [Sumerlaeia bacterium]